MDRTEKNETATRSVSENETSEQEQPIEELPEIFIKKGTQTIIPLRINNTNRTNIFKINVEGGNEWIYTEDKILKIAPLDTQTVDLIIEPNENVTEGDYKVGITIEGQKIIFSKNFLLQVRNSKVSNTLSYVVYIIAGLIVLAGIIAYLQSREKEMNEPAIEEKEENKETKKMSGRKKSKKTDLKLK